VKPTFKVTNFFNNECPQISIDVHRSAKLAKCPVKYHRTPRNQEEKEDKENIINKINPPTEFKVEDERPTLPTLTSLEME
jgi:hypothetical protein